MWDIDFGVVGYIRKLIEYLKWFESYLQGSAESMPFKRKLEGCHCYKPEQIPKKWAILLFLGVFLFDIYRQAPLNLPLPLSNNNIKDSRDKKVVENKNNDKD